MNYMSKLEYCGVNWKVMETNGLKWYLMVDWCGSWCDKKASNYNCFLLFNTKILLFLYIINK